MSERRAILQRRIMVGALMAAVATLPYSIKVCHTAIIILIINWLFEGAWRNKLTTIRHSMLLQFIIALFLLQIAGLAFADNFMSGWFSVEKRLFFVLTPVALATTSIKLSRQDLKVIFSTFVASCLAGTVICLYHAWLEMMAPTATNPSFLALPGEPIMTWHIYSYVGLAHSIGIHPTYFSLYLAVCLLLVLESMIFTSASKRKILSALLVVYLAVFIVLLSSRIIIAGTCLIFAFILVRSIIQKRFAVGLIAVGTLTTLVVMVFVNPVTRYRIVGEISATTFKIEPNTHYTTAAQIRASLWWIAAHALAEANPLTGFGTGDVNKIMDETSTSYGITNIINSSDPHNQYLYTWLSNGVPGLVMLLICLLLPAWLACAKGDFMTCAFVLLFCLVCTTESALELQKGIVFYALMSGLLFFHKHSFQEDLVDFRYFLRAGEQRQ